MKLDSRIIEGKRPLSCMDTDEAKKFIGKEGYFANCLRVFKTIEYFEKWTLTGINEKEERCFEEQITGGDFWDYFLPAEWVKEKEPEPVWKPYDLDSLREDNFTLGRKIVMRQKFIAKEPARIHTVMYLGHSENAENLNDVEILLGNIWFGAQRLLDDFEIFDDNYSTIGQPEWRPFGYQE